MQKYKVKEIILTGVSSGDPVYRTFLETAKADGIDFKFIQNDQDIQISPDLYLDVLYPFSGQSLIGQTAANRMAGKI